MSSLVGVAALALLSLCTKSDNHNDDTIGYGGMVGSMNIIASKAGRKILAMGGTAADAAVAVQMVLNVVQPQSTGIGGGVFIMYYDAESGATRAIDGREEAPAAYNPYVFCEDGCFESNGAGNCTDCDTITFSERRTGGLAVGVPGTLSAFKRLWEIYGAGDDVISWSDLFTDAIDIAKNGFPAYQVFVDSINGNLQGLGRFDATCKLFLNYPSCNESKYELGDTVTFADLSNMFSTLASLTADEAVNKFYTGDIGQAIVNATTSAMNDVTGRNGLMTMDDMAQYRAVFREPVSSTVSLDDKTYNIVGMNMPSSGPLTVQYWMKVLEYAVANDESIIDDDAYSAQSFHSLLSAGNIAFADRNQYMADSDYVNVPIAGMQDEDYLKQRAADYMTDMAQTMPIPFGFPDGWNETAQSDVNEGGTAHFNIVDRFGNVASITSTVESAFGSYVTVDGYGFLLNNELTDFGSQGIVDGVVVNNGPEGGKKKRNSAIDVLGYKDNETSGGKRPRSSMSPNIVFSADTGKPIMAVGARGGATIICSTAVVILRHLLYGMGPQQAVNSARAYPFNLGNGAVLFEKALWTDSNANISMDLVDDFGYNSGLLIEYGFGTANAIVFGADGDNKLYCGADYTRNGEEGCSAVCNETQSVCPFSMTTSYPVTTFSTNIEETKETDDADGCNQREISLFCVVISIFVLFL